VVIGFGGVFIERVCQASTGWMIPVPRNVPYIDGERNTNPLSLTKTTNCVSFLNPLLTSYAGIALGTYRDTEYQFPTDCNITTARRHRLEHFLAAERFPEDQIRNSRKRLSAH
jgi:hypothetical protein